MICMLVAAILVGCVTQSSERWNLYDAGPFTFSMPSSLQKNGKFYGYDSYVREFTNEDMSVSFDFGMYSGEPSPDLKEIRQRRTYSSHVENIAGQNVQIVAFDGVPIDGFRFKHEIVAIYLGAGLTMKAECKTGSDYVDAKRIFRSVKFNKNVMGY